MAETGEIEFNVPCGIWFHPDNGDLQWRQSWEAAGEADRRELIRLAGTWGVLPTTGPDYASPVPPIMQASPGTTCWRAMGGGGTGGSSPLPVPPDLPGRTLWQRIGDWLRALFDRIRNALAGAVAGIREFLARIGDLLGNVFGAAGRFILYALLALAGFVVWRLARR